MSSDSQSQLRALAPLAVEILTSVSQHRLLTASQVHDLHTPAASFRWTQQLLETLADRGLAARASGPRRQALWFATASGAETIQAAGTLAEPRRHLITPAQAVGPLRAHTLAVNDVGLAFFNAARERPQDEFGPFSWRHEIAHPYRPGRGRNGTHLLIADALLSYLQANQDTLTLHQRFLELDRGTIPCELLAAKLACYTQMRHYTSAEPGSAPLWRNHYRSFPQVLVVLASQDTKAANRRIQRAIALLRSEATPQREAAQVAFTTLTDLATEGPFAQVFISAAQPDHYHDWLHTPLPAPEER